MKLTEPQLSALREINRIGYSFSIPCQTGEALRRRGLVARHTEYLIGAVYVDRDSSVRQYWCTAKKPFERHEWMMTKEGKIFLQSMERT